MRACSLGVQLACAPPAQTRQWYSIVPKRQDGLVDPFGWQYTALDKALHFQHGVCISARLTHMHHWVTYGKFKVLAEVRIQANYIAVLVSPSLVVEAHGLGSTPVQSVSGV
jgi:hypothetical protein